MIKKLLSTVALVFTFAITMAAQNTVTLLWSPSADPTVAGYNVYYKLSTAPSFSVTNVAGATTTNVTLGNIIVGAVYQYYATSIGTNGLESDVSNQVRYQTFIVNGSKSTGLALGDVGTTNFPSFQLVLNPTNGSITGTAPNVAFNPTAGFPSVGKDQFSYKSPELFGNQNVTNTYAVYKTSILPPGALKATAN